MKHLLFYILLVTLCSNCTKNKKRTIVGASEFQRELNAIFKDASKSPLKKADLKKFKGLKFFAIDSSYIVTATLSKVKDSAFFDFPTTTNRTIRYRKFALAKFKLNQKEHTLELYQGKDTKDELFLPFLDLTNSKTSYSGGRYITLKASKNTKNIKIDFNKAYNPYCAYNKKYSCPLTPRNNYLNIEIKAGEKNYFPKQ